MNQILKIKVYKGLESKSKPHIQNKKLGIIVAQWTERTPRLHIALIIAGVGNLGYTSKHLNLNNCSAKGFYLIECLLCYPCFLSDLTCQHCFCPCKFISSQTGYEMTLNTHLFPFPFSYIQNYILRTEEQQSIPHLISFLLPQQSHKLSFITSFTSLST